MEVFEKLGLEYKEEILESYLEMKMNTLLEGKMFLSSLRNNRNFYWRERNLDMLPMRIVDVKKFCSYWGVQVQGDALEMVQEHMEVYFRQYGNKYKFTLIGDDLLKTFEDQGKSGKEKINRIFEGYELKKVFDADADKKFHLKIAEQIDELEEAFKSLDKNKDFLNLQILELKIIVEEQIERLKIQTP